MWSATFDRTSLSLSPLVIGSNPYLDDFHMAEDDATWPSFKMRRAYAPDSDFVEGKQLLTAVRDAGEIALTIYAHTSTTALLVTAMDKLEAATSQFTYDFTLTVDGVARTYVAHAELPKWGALDSGMVKAHLMKATITIPLNPAVA